MPEGSPRSASKISSTEWWLLLGIYVAFDIFQFILDALAVGLVANRFIDIVLGMGLLLYLKMRGVPLNTKILALVGASFIAEEVPAIDVAPFWSFDVWKIKGWVQAGI